MLFEGRGGKARGTFDVFPCDWLSLIVRQYRRVYDFRFWGKSRHIEISQPGDRDKSRESCVLQIIHERKRCASTMYSLDSRNISSTLVVVYIAVCVRVCARKYVTHIGFFFLESEQR